MNPIPSAPSAPTAPFRRMTPLARVGLRAEACVARRSPLVRCEHCTRACPHDCLSIADGVLSLDPMQCSSCGQCAAACPGGALTVEGFAAPARAAAKHTAIVCERMSAPSDPTAHRVPCLGGVALDGWLQLVALAGEQPIRVPAQTICNRCEEAPPGGVPWPARLKTARRTLLAAGLPEHGLPLTIPVVRLPNGNGGRTAEAGMAPGRRGFFTGMSRAIAVAASRAATATDGTAGRAAPIPRASREVARPGEAVRALALDFAHAHGRQQPREAALPALSASEACRADGTCVRTCPTGALQFEHGTDGRHARLLFDAWRCVECGLCAQLCPEHGLRLAARDWRPFPSSPATLATFEARECAHCGASLLSPDLDDLCDTCRKRERLAQAGFSLFGPKRGRWPATPAGP